MRGVLTKDESESDLTVPAREAARLANVVVAVDGSDVARDAIVLAARVAAAFGSTLHLVHAVQPARRGAGPTVLDEARVGDAFELAERTVAAERAVLRSAVAAPVECVRLGHPAEEVVAIARTRRADLIVTGTRDDPGARRFASGSTAGEIIRRSDVPVLVAHEGAVAPPAAGPLFRRPLVAVDFGDASRAALGTAALLARGVEVSALHVVLAGPAWTSEGTSALATRYMRARAVAAERARLEAWLRAARAEDGRANVRGLVAVGEPATAVVDAAVGGGHDLVACGTHARRAPAPELVGSVAEAILDAVTCPVLVLREAR